MRWLIVILMALVTACAAPRTPVPSDTPECAKPDKEPIDGGLGGTGNQRDADCTDD